ncbi:hypothetical protein PAXRUDRAFT_156354 [Paxillus rubicundulus Ve08.2h10]|uniref:DDE Tnp4 domain-containing protein n=1 Tax=Paxillus rubicundulus Ve08.2h10 TaxID=930991 RepID=A0A0D0DB77_9AGAM|nr:hypothetical protein PAXRUDRAFT_156354 [Paxillus rubicundulus Ve08.2h10]
MHSRTHIAKNHETIIPWGYWTWAYTTYPTEKWCVVPFKKPQGGRLDCKQNTHNQYVQVCIEHAFTALKGHFQFLFKFCFQLQIEQDLHITIYWVECCLILHNMIIWFEEQWQGE